MLFVFEYKMNLTVFRCAPIIFIIIIIMNWNFGFLNRSNTNSAKKSFTICLNEMILWIDDLTHYY